MHQDKGTRSTKVAHSPSEARKHPNMYRGQPDQPNAAGGYTGTVVCGTCHVIWNNKHWHLDEKEYAELSVDPSIETVVCPSCKAIEGEMYDGDVTLRSHLIPKNEEAIMGLIYNTERHIRTNNPLARIARLTIEGDTIRVLTITTFLAERIGKELKKAYHGHLELNHPEREEFIRVTWFRDE